MPWQLNDGGRSGAGLKGKAGDCACRALAITTGMSYLTAFDLINTTATCERRGKRKRGVSNASSGVYRACMVRVMAALGWTWVPTMFIGSGCKVHLREDELPSGRLLVSLSLHYTAVIDGVIHDTYNPSRGGTRCVYGYWHRP